MEDAKKGIINGIIVKDLSRLGRNYIEMGRYLEQIFLVMNIRFIAINDAYDTALSNDGTDSMVIRKGQTTRLSLKPFLVHT